MNTDFGERKVLNDQQPEKINEFKPQLINVFLYIAAKVVYFLDRNFCEELDCEVKVKLNGKS